MSRNSVDARGRAVNGNETPRSSVDKAKGNGSVSVEGNGSSIRGGSTLEEVHAELERTKQEKETLEGQYRTLLDRLSDMKSKIGLKLQEDAVRIYPSTSPIPSVLIMNITRTYATPYASAITHTVHFRSKRRNSSNGRP